VTLRILVACLALAACKKHPQPTVPQLPDSSRMTGGGVFESDKATVFHEIYRYSGNKAQAIAFYQPEMEKRGATLQGDTFVDDNLVHSGGFGSEGSAAPKDPSRPAVWLSVFDLPNETRVDLWESVPKG
jgi:hypothetical protein